MAETALRIIGVLLLLGAVVLFRNRMVPRSQAKAGAALTGAIGLLCLDVVYPWISIALAAAAIVLVFRSVNGRIAPVDRA